MRVLTREALTAALAARQFLLERQSLTPAEAIRRLTPLQGQHPPSPHIALAARLSNFTQRDLEAALDAKHVVKATLMRMTLHVANGDDFPAYAQLARHHRMRAFRARYPELDEERVVADLATWCKTPRNNAEIRERVRGYTGAPDDTNVPLLLARTFVPLMFTTPARHWRDTTRKATFVVDPRPLPDPEAGRFHRRAPRSRRASWVAGISRCSPTPTAIGSSRPRVQPLKLTLSGDSTLTVDGRVAASWTMDGPKLVITKHTDFDHAAVREEALRTARFCAPEHTRHEVTFVN